MKTFEYQNKKSKDYFEGWYFRFTASETNKNYAVIFAITKNLEDSHSFIQVFSDTSEVCDYLRFKVEKFSYDYIENRLHIGKSSLSTTSIHLDTPSLKMDLDFSNKLSLESQPGSNSAMGYLSKVPLECFQEVIYLNGKGKGTINKDNVEGTIYIEKTYGSKFPVQWVWLQSNHSKKSSMTFSVGKIPFFGIKAKGFLAILKTPEKLYRFYTGNLSTVKVLKDKIIVRRGLLKLVLLPMQNETIKLVGPSQKALMNLDVFESLTSTLKLELYRGNKLIFKDSYTNVGYENMW
ncbi:hypothetical protein KQ51_00111 [Candidatus Izimaplasma bacterium HR1]|jgi:hypothetical protein|uniref:hypothetical protein n=1 Tax=Candidatus Izimoplasma sp. HR1 TaxID=1541959 RepID=UPI0004F74C6F|nr:hypothetical protein KQ51_00111 [Candidatus Izimaplasma bacterium HR1]